MKVKSESEVAQSSPTVSDPIDCSLPGSSVCGIFQARVLECELGLWTWLDGIFVLKELIGRPDGEGSTYRNT